MGICIPKIWENWSITLGNFFWRVPFEINLKKINWFFFRIFHRNIYIFLDQRIHWRRWRWFGWGWWWRIWLRGKLLFLYQLFVYILSNICLQFFSGNISRIFCYSPWRWRYCSRRIPNFPHCSPILGTRKSRMVCSIQNIFTWNQLFVFQKIYIICLHYRYGQLTAGLTQDNVKAVQEVFKLCEQRQAAKRSKSIEQAGGK